MALGLARGEILLIAFIFGLIYLAGLLPKISARLARDARGDRAASKPKPTGE